MNSVSSPQRPHAAKKPSFKPADFILVCPSIKYEAPSLTGVGRDTSKLNVVGYVRDGGKGVCWMSAQANAARSATLFPLVTSELLIEPLNNSITLHDLDQRTYRWQVPTSDNTLKEKDTKEALNKLKQISDILSRQ